MSEEMSPDFLFMRLVSAAEYDHLDHLDQPQPFMSGKAGLGHSGGPLPALGLTPPHYSPVPGKGELKGGLLLREPPPGSEAPPSRPPTEDFAVAAQSFVDFQEEPGSRAQLMVFQNLLRSSDRILERPPSSGLLRVGGERQRVDSDSGSYPAPPRQDQDLHCGLSSEKNPQWRAKGSQPERGSPPSESLICPRHRQAKWPPGLLDQALSLGLLDARKEDTVVALDPLGEDKATSVERDQTGHPLPRCSCLQDPGNQGVVPGEDPSQTSDALLVLEGLGRPIGEVSGEVGTRRRLEPLFSDGTLSGLMEQVHRLAGESGVCTGQTWGKLDLNAPACSKLPQSQSLSCCAHRSPRPDPQPYQALSQPHSTPKPGLGRSTSPLLVLKGDLGAERTSRSKSRKGGSLKVRLGKLFRTKSSGGGPAGLLDKRPSLAWSTLSGGSLVDVWVSNMEEGGRRQTCTLPYAGETVSLLDVDFHSPRPPTPPPPPRRSLSLLDGLGGAAVPRASSLRCNGGGSMRSLPPRPVAPPPSPSISGESLSVLRASPGPVPRRPDLRPLPPRQGPRQAGNLASSLRELQKCGWYWGPMTWEDAEMKLKATADGSFLVRDSSDPRYILSLSFRSQGVTHHTRMEHYRGTFSLWCHPKFEDRCHSLVEFIERAMAHSEDGKFLYFLRSRVPGLPPTPVQLLYPVSRFSSIKTLQHLCRFCIRQLVRIDHIQDLPLPRTLITYLRRFYYYEEEEKEEVGPPPEAGERQESCST
ncbi:suppressor of cytokine signaling 7-like isoform X2 [Nerophis ophidion]|uniref:suppressor of cytokine signaling 7-like isoform X2 n=1 Tax=Nerophis ophidion TaxID=159077 RepID=UPI002ADFFF84|nr:suppressor of cytokine signaling 7-like isoform X2 [Nerophis ophidion]